MRSKSARTTLMARAGGRRSARSYRRGDGAGVGVLYAFNPMGDEGLSYASDRTVSMVSASSAVLSSR